MADLDLSLGVVGQTSTAISNTSLVRFSLVGILSWAYQPKLPSAPQLVIASNLYDSDRRCSCGRFQFTIVRPRERDQHPSRRIETHITAVRYFQGEIIARIVAMTCINLQLSQLSLIKEFFLKMMAARQVRRIFLSLQMHAFCAHICNSWRLGTAPIVAIGVYCSRCLHYIFSDELHRDDTFIA